jgi:alkanesulfonate monooxygenase SsuD/methylene tetrahydromethanopterin reductase-like flavin-dependent oxidoreductase (luciferase family)
MRCGVSMPMIGDPAALVDLAVSAEQAGWDGFFLWDHLQLDAITRPEVHDPWVLLGAIAARTRRMRLGTLVTPVPRRRPWKLAREVVTLDHLSGGRAILGVGLGVPADIEYGAFGEATDARTHAAMLDEALPLLDAFLRGEPVEHDGEYYQVHAHLNPPALQEPRPPIWVAATFGRRRPLERARRWDGIVPLNPAGPLSSAELAELVKALDPPPGYDIVTALGPDESVDALAEAGATWLIDGPAPDETFAGVQARVGLGPPRD